MTESGGSVNSSHNVSSVQWKPIETAPRGETILVARRGSDGKKYVDLVPGEDNDFVWSAYLPWEGLDQPYAWAEPPKPPPLPRRKVNLASYRNPQPAGGGE